MEADARKELTAELGELTYKRAKLQAELNVIAQRSNEIGTLLEKAEKDGTRNPV